LDKLLVILKLNPHHKSQLGILIDTKPIPESKSIMQHAHVRKWKGVEQ
jgi:hypothetical protein